MSFCFLSVLQMKMVNIILLLVQQDEAGKTYWPEQQASHTGCKASHWAATIVLVQIIYETLMNMNIYQVKSLHLAVKQIDTRF